MKPQYYLLIGLFGSACSASPARGVPTRGQIEAATDKFCADVASVRKFEREFDLSPEAGAPGK